MEKGLALIKDDLQKVEEEYKKRLVSRVPLITTVAEHLVMSGGKRFRPTLLLLSARLCGYQGDDHIPLAGVIEFIHTATLLHDDVIDNAEVRRGSASANTLWGNEASVLVGDFLFSRSFAMMVEVGDLRILQTLALATTALAEGETMELVKTADLSITEEENLELIINKTAVLISAAARIGAILGKAPLEVEDALAYYGLQVGIAFQLADDCLDYIGEKEALGKEIGSDLKEGKITLPLIHSLGHCTSEERKEIQEIVQSDEFPPDGLQKAISFIKKYNGIDYTFAKAQQYISEGKNKLMTIPPSPEREAFLEMADYVVERRI
ncbi:MAG: polyprenyl synthetase family protein [Deltaproteobacteria bacterium]|nr:MAG: polyprenyl synthetase family protein [Deltaproteobacteria bacterium]